jgi:hypothetical protein
MILDFARRQSFLVDAGGVEEEVLDEPPEELLEEPLEDELSDAAAGFDSDFELSEDAGWDCLPLPLP